MVEQKPVVDVALDIYKEAAALFEDEDAKKVCQKWIDSFARAKENLAENFPEEVEEETKNKIMKYRSAALDAKSVSELDTIMFRLYVANLITPELEAEYRSLPKLAELQETMNTSVEWFNEELGSIEEIHGKAVEVQEKYNKLFTEEAGEFVKQEQEAQLKALYERRAIDVYNAILNGNNEDEAEALAANAFDEKIDRLKETLYGEDEDEEEDED